MEKYRVIETVYDGEYFNIAYYIADKCRQILEDKVELKGDTYNPQTFERTIHLKYKNVLKGFTVTPFEPIDIDKIAEELQEEYNSDINGLLS